MLIFNNIESKSENLYAVIMLHVYGGNVDSLKPLLNMISFKNNVSFYFVQAPYLIKEESFSWSYEIEAGFWERDEPKKLLDEFFEKVIFRDYKHSNIFLLGFSQGAFVCFEYGLNINQKLGGVFPIAGFTEKFPSINKVQVETPLIIGHGFFFLNIADHFAFAFISIICMFLFWIIWNKTTGTFQLHKLLTLIALSGLII